MSGEPDKAKLDVEPVVPPPPMLGPIAAPVPAGPANGNAVAAVQAEVASPIGMTDEQIAHALEGEDGRFYAGRILAMVERWGGLRAFEQRNPQAAPLFHRRVAEVTDEPTYRWMLAHDAEILTLVKNGATLQAHARALADRMAGRPTLKGYAIAAQFASSYELDYALVATGYKQAGDGAWVGWHMMFDDVDGAAAHVDEAVEAAQADAEAAAALAAQRKARAETLIGQKVASRERTMWFDQAIALESLLGPEDGLDALDTALAWARLAGCATAVARLDGRYFIYKLNHDYGFNQIWLADWFQDKATTLVPASSAGSPDVFALITTEGYVVTPRDGERFFGGAQAKAQGSFRRADLDILEHHGDEVNAGAMLRQLALDTVLMRLSDAETHLRKVRGRLMPDLAFDPAQGKALQARTRELRLHLVQAAQLSHDLEDPPTLVQRIALEDELEQIGEMASDDPAAADMIISHRDEKDTSRPKTSDFENRVGDLMPGDALSLALSDVDTKLSNVDKVRRYFYENPDAVYAFDELIASSREQFPASQQLSLTFHMFQHSMSEIAGFLGMAVKELGLLVAGFATEGPVAVAVWGLGVVRGAAGVKEGFEHADRLAAMANLDYEGGMVLASTDEARSAKRWAWIWVGLALLDAGLFVGSANQLFRMRAILADPKLARLIQSSGKTFVQISKDLGMSEHALAAELATARGAVRDQLLDRIRRVNLASHVLASGQFESRTGLLAEKFLEKLPGESVKDWRRRVLKAISDQFDEAIMAEYEAAIARGEQPGHATFDGIFFERTGSTRFDAKERALVFTRDASLNKFSVAEEVQHALDYALGARNPKDILEKGREALADSKGMRVAELSALTDKDVEWINNWWHRRVFTRMMKNIEAERFGLGYLKSRLPEIHALYQEIGGTLSLKDILEKTWSGIY